MVPAKSVISVFFFNDTATTEIYTLSLHDALPIGLHAERADARGLADLRATLHRRRQHARDRARHVEPAVAGVERDVGDMGGQRQPGLQVPGAFGADPLRRVATSRQTLDAGAELALVVAAVGPFQR